MKKTYPPILYAPTPPAHALTNEGSASKETGLKDPVAKYGPTGPMMTKIIAFPGRDTPRDGCVRGEDKSSLVLMICAFKATLTHSDLIRNCVGHVVELRGYATTHFSSDERGSDVEAGVLGVGNPLLVDLHQLPNALQHFSFIKQLHGRKDIYSHH